MVKNKTSSNENDHKTYMIEGMVCLIAMIEFQAKNEQKFTIFQVYTAKKYVVLVTRLPKSMSFIMLNDTCLRCVLPVSPSTRKFLHN